MHIATAAVTMLKPNVKHFRAMSPPVKFLTGTKQKSPPQATKSYHGVLPEEYFLIVCQKSHCMFSHSDRDTMLYVITN